MGPPRAPHHDPPLPNATHFRPRVRWPHRGSDSPTAIAVPSPRLPPRRPVPSHIRSRREGRGRAFRQCRSRSRASGASRAWHFQARNGRDGRRGCDSATARSEEHTSELQSLMRTSYAVFCLKKKIQTDKSILSYTPTILKTQTQQALDTQIHNHDYISNRHHHTT